MKAPALLIAERLAISNGFELLDQLLAVEEESSAGLVAAEAVEQLDGLPAFEAEEFFDHGTVEDGGFEQAEFLDDAGKVKQPMGLWRQGEPSLLSIRYRTIVRNGVFPGCKVPYDNSYRRLSGQPSTLYRIDSSCPPTPKSPSAAPAARAANYPSDGNCVPLP